MAWVRVSASTFLVESPGASSYFVYDPAVSEALRYKCASSTDADTLVTKLNSVDYP